MMKIFCSHLDVALVAEPRQVAGLTGEFPRHALGHLELGGGGEDGRWGHR